jgi:hypothetical protein
VIFKRIAAIIIPILLVYFIPYSANLISGLLRSALFEIASYGSLNDLHVAIGIARACLALVLIILALVLVGKPSN